MKPAMVFARRNTKELLRDPLSWTLCVGLPVVMYIVMHFAFYIKGVADWFAADYLAPGIAVFSFAFVMLNVTLLVSKDRSSALLARLFTSPLRASDYLLGYAIPSLLIAVGQMVCCYVVAIIAGRIGGVYFSAPGMLLSIVAMIPTMLMYIAIGVLFGCWFSETAAPGCTSAIITFSGFMCGAWAPVDVSTGFGIVCRCFPFYSSVAIARGAMGLMPMTTGQVIGHLATIVAYTVALVWLAIWAFRRVMRADNKAA